jgi:hypothetical protein
MVSLAAISANVKAPLLLIASASGCPIVLSLITDIN